MRALEVLRMEMVTVNDSNFPLPRRRLETPDIPDDITNQSSAKHDFIITPSPLVFTFAVCAGPPESVFLES
jgi:hypothetical protein